MTAILSDCGSVAAKKKGAETAAADAGVSVDGGLALAVYVALPRR